MIQHQYYTNYNNTLSSILLQLLHNNKNNTESFQKVGACVTFQNMLYLLYLRRRTLLYPYSNDVVDVVINHPFPLLNVLSRLNGSPDFCRSIAKDVKIMENSAHFRYCFSPKV
jgi:hypothetical protein